MKAVSLLCGWQILPWCNIIGLFNMTSNDAVFPLQSSLSFGAPPLDFSVDFLFLRRDTKPQRHRVMFCEECPVVTRMMSPLPQQPNTAPVLSAQLQSDCDGADGESYKYRRYRSKRTLHTRLCDKRVHWLHKDPDFNALVGVTKAHFHLTALQEGDISAPACGGEAAPRGSSSSSQASATHTTIIFTHTHTQRDEVSACVVASVQLFWSTYNRHWTCLTFPQLSGTIRDT